MTIKSAFAAIIPALALGACDRPVHSPESPPTATSVPDAPATAPDMTTPPSGNSRGDAADESKPGAIPPPLVPEAEKGVKGARNVLLSFARAIELKRFGQAWAMLGPADRQKWSQAQFKTLFADLGEITVAIPEGESDAGAGSLFYIAPVTITADDRDGRPVRLEGEARLRRVNDVDGATAEQLRWHLEHLTLDWTH